MATDAFTDQRDALMAEIRAQARETEPWTGRAAFSHAVMAAMAAVPRHDFVPASERAVAYLNRPLPIGHGQTISQPYIVAVMTDLLDLTGTERVLEIGTGCGYQSAVLARVCAHVTSVETVPDLADAASARLNRLGVSNVTVHLGDGWQGWPDGAPYDAILVTAAAETMPPALIEQLAPGGRIIIPIGPRTGPQILVVGAKTRDGKFRTANTLPVAFVPLVQRDERKSLF